MIILMNQRLVLEVIWLKIVKEEIIFFEKLKAYLSKAEKVLHLKEFIRHSKFLMKINLLN
jgi:hypothetical protein